MSSTKERFAILISERANSRSLPDAPRPVELPAAEQDEPSGLGYAEGQSFMIEYEDALGNFSRRRITVWGISETTSGIPALQARCHERKATRNFRIDRIQCVIDYDGEIFDDVPAFLEETFGMRKDIADLQEDEEDAYEWERIRRTVRPYAVLLNALSESDGTIRDAETEVAADFCVWLCDQKEIFVTDGNRRALKRYILRHHPDSRLIIECCDKVLSADPHVITKFLVACIKLMDADLIRHPSEVELINQLSGDLTGMPVI